MNWCIATQKETKRSRNANHALVSETTNNCDVVIVRRRYDQLSLRNQIRGDTSLFVLHRVLSSLRLILSIKIYELKTLSGKPRLYCAAASRWPIINLPYKCCITHDYYSKPIQLFNHVADFYSFRSRLCTGEVNWNVIGYVTLSSEKVFCRGVGKGEGEKIPISSLT